MRVIAAVVAGILSTAVLAWSGLPATRADARPGVADAVQAPLDTCTLKITGMT